MIASISAPGTQPDDWASRDPGSGASGDGEASAQRPRSNSYHYVTVRDVARPMGAPCPLRKQPILGHDRTRSLFVRLKDRMRFVRTETGDFSEAELRDIKDGIGQVYLDVSSKLAPDDFARDLRKLRLAGECRSCERHSECAGAWIPVAGDLFTRDDAHVRAVVAGLSGRVLDIGGGEGGYLSALTDRAALGAIDYVCVDPDETSLAVFASRYPFARFIAGYAEQLGDDIGTFDHVLILRSYNHLIEPAKVLARMVGLLRPGGTLTVVDNVAFGLVRGPVQAARAESAPQNRFEHYRNDGAAEAAATVESLFASPRSDGRMLRLLDRRDVGEETSNQWLLRYECVEQGRVRA